MTDSPLPRRYVCARACGSLEIDGRLDKPAWQHAPWTEDFLDIEGPDHPRPRFRTRVKMLWDDQFLYIGAEMEEPHVWATLTERDSVIFQDNDFEVFIDADGDNHDYYEIEVNALATVWDLRLVTPYRDGGPALNAWDIPDLRCAVRIDGTLNDPRDEDHGWTVEMAIPWTALAEYARRPAPPSPGDQWRVNFSRVEWDTTTGGGRYRKVPDRPEHNWVWSPQGAIDMHRPERWGYVQFASSTAEPFRPDPSAPARDWLMAVYHAQRRHHALHGRWASVLSNLDDVPPWPGPAGDLFPRLELTADGFVARAGYVRADGTPGRVFVRHDSRLWEDSPADNTLRSNHP